MLKVKRGKKGGKLLMVFPKQAFSKNYVIIAKDNLKY